MNQLSHVINYELPNISETYVHRIGRTGRAGHDGIAISFCESEELPYLKDIQKLIGLQIPVVKDHPWVTVEGEKAQAGKTEELKEKAKANKVYRGSVEIAAALKDIDMEALTLEDIIRQALKRMMK